MSLTKRARENRVEWMRTGEPVAADGVGETAPIGPSVQRAPEVLLAFDNSDDRAAMARRFEKEGYSVTQCGDGLQLLDNLAPCLVSADEMPSKREAFDLIIVDIRLPGMMGLVVLEGMLEFPRRSPARWPPLILTTPLGDAEAHTRATQLGAAAVLDKPFRLDELMRSARELAAPTVATPSEPM